ncbi:MAG: PQQ-binding-like beta-propeller repeat protein, partial [Planctomycetes bacterium]|nr:PQQ-binding-like beta-propeller repeat protein [Planctomycetota bacterium]
MPALRLLHITDLHLDGVMAVALLSERLRAVIKKLKPDAVVVSGDVVFDTPADWDVVGHSYRDMWKHLDIPVFQCPGNHDLKNNDDTYDVTKYEYYNGPSQYMTCFKGFSLLSLNVVSHQSKASVRQSIADEKKYGTNMQWPTVGTPTPNELKKWRKQSGRKPMIIIQHFIPNQGDMQRYNDVGVRAVLSGHWHASKIHKHGACTSYNTANSLFSGTDGTPASFLIVDFKKDGSNTAQWHAIEAVGKLAKATAAAHHWKQQLSGTIERADVCSNGQQLFISSHQRNRSDGLSFALAAHNGKLLWKKKTDQPIKNGLCVGDDCVFGNGYGGKLYAFDQQTGRIKWTGAIGNGVDRFVNSRPRLDKRGHILTGNYHTFQSYSQQGQLLWGKHLGSEFATCWVEPIYNEETDTVLVTQTWGSDKEHAILEAETGERRHTHDPGVLDTYSLTPCIHNGVIYSSNSRIQASVYGSNKILWSSEAIGVPSGFMYMCKNGLIVPRADGKVVCVDPKNG